MNKTIHSKRSGLSIIEVLTSIVVALIGVFGVMALIPFSVKQSQSGLDRDAVTMIARNALARFEAEGYKSVSDDPLTGAKQLNWLLGTGVRYGTNNLNLVCIDPLGITEQAGFGTFPFNHANLSGNAATPPMLLSIPTVNLIKPNGLPFGIGDARRLFRITDDLVFEDSVVSTLSPDAELNGPNQVFNTGVSGTLDRQSVGSISWCALAHPNVSVATSTEVDSYKFYIMVFKDRITAPAPESTMVAAVVTDPAPSLTSQLLTSVTIDAPPGDTLRRDDWVMLINEEDPATSPGSAAARTNLAFARVTNITGLNLIPDRDNAADHTRLTLDGPDFQFSRQTRLVHLQNVLSVYARTINLETPSSWNISF